MSPPCCHSSHSVLFKMPAKCPSCSGLRDSVRTVRGHRTENILLAHVPEALLHARDSRALVSHRHDQASRISHPRSGYICPIPWLGRAAMGNNRPGTLISQESRQESQSNPFPSRDRAGIYKSNHETVATKPDLLSNRSGRKTPWGSAGMDSSSDAPRHYIMAGPGLECGTKRHFTN